MAALTFNVVYEDAGEGWVCAHVPELPEVQTQGEDLADARATVREAIGLVPEERRARGEPIPQTGWALVEAVEIAASLPGTRTSPRTGLTPAGHPELIARSTS